MHPIANGSPITSNPAALLIPEIPGATLSLMALGGPTDVDVFTTRTGFPDSPALVNLALSAPVHATSPTDGATLVDTTTALTWAAPTGSASNVTLTPFDTKNGQYNVYTAQSTATIPDLTAQGIALPSGAKYGGRSPRSAPR